MINRKLHKSCHFSVYIFTVCPITLKIALKCAMYGMFFSLWLKHASHTHAIQFIYTFIKFHWVFSFFYQYHWFYFVGTPKWKRDENDRNRNYWICVNVTIYFSLWPNCVDFISMLLFPSLFLSFVSLNLSEYTFDWPVQICVNVRQRQKYFAI